MNDVINMQQYLNLDIILLDANPDTFAKGNGQRGNCDVVIDVVSVFASYFHFAIRREL